MTLGAITGAGAHGDHSGITTCRNVLASRAVTAFTLDIGFGLKILMHGIPIAFLHRFRKGPFHQFGDIVKSTIVGFRSSVVSQGVA